MARVILEQTRNKGTHKVGYKQWVQVLGYIDPIYYLVYLIIILSTSIAVASKGEDFGHSFASQEKLYEWCRHQYFFQAVNPTLRKYGWGTQEQRKAYFRMSFFCGLYTTVTHLLLSPCLLLSVKLKKHGASLSLALVWLLGNFTLSVGYSIWRIRDGFWITLFVGIAVRIAPLVIVVVYIKHLRRKRAIGVTEEISLGKLTDMSRLEVGGRRPMTSLHP